MGWEERAISFFSLTSYIVTALLLYPGRGPLPRLLEAVADGSATGGAGGADRRRPKDLRQSGAGVPQERGRVEGVRRFRGQGRGVPQSEGDFGYGAAAGAEGRRAVAGHREVSRGFQLGKYVIVRSVLCGGNQALHPSPSLTPPLPPSPPPSPSPPPHPSAEWSWRPGTPKPRTCNWPKPCRSAPPPGSCGRRRWHSRHAPSASPSRLRV